MKTIFEIPTSGDDMTMPGGIALRFNESRNEFVVHNYSTDRATGTERNYFQGSYFCSESQSLAAKFSEALSEFHYRVEKASRYQTGGSLDMETLLGLSAGIPA
jgi:hypothetical protein